MGGSLFTTVAVIAAALFLILAVIFAGYWIIGRLTDKKARAEEREKQARLDEERQEGASHAHGRPLDPGGLVSRWRRRRERWLREHGPKG